MKRSLRKRRRYTRVRTHRCAGRHPSTGSRPDAFPMAHSTLAVEMCCCWSPGRGRGKTSTLLELNPCRLARLETRARPGRADNRLPQESVDGLRLFLQRRLLPKATPELNAMDDLWRHTKRKRGGPSHGNHRTLGPTGLHVHPPNESARTATTRGVLSGIFWLAKCNNSCQ